MNKQAFKPWGTFAGGLSTGLGIGATRSLANNDSALKTLGNISLWALPGMAVGAGADYLRYKNDEQGLLAKIRKLMHRAQPDPEIKKLEEREKQVSPGKLDYLTHYVMGGGPISNLSFQGDVTEQRRNEILKMLEEKHMNGDDRKYLGYLLAKDPVLSSDSSSEVKAGAFELGRQMSKQAKVTLKFHSFEDLRKAFDTITDKNATKVNVNRLSIFNPADEVDLTKFAEEEHVPAMGYASDYPRHLLVPPEMLLGGAGIGALLGGGLAAGVAPGCGTAGALTGAGVGALGGTLGTWLVLDAIKHKEINKLRRLHMHGRDIKPGTLFNLDTMGSLVEHD